MFESWREVVGDIKPTHRPGSLEEFIRLLPEGTGVIPMTVGIRSGTEKEFHDVLADYQAKAAELAELGVGLIHIGGAPPMMVHGFAGETKIVKDMETKHNIPVSTSGRSQIDAMRALGVKRFVGVTYFKESLNQIFTRYFTEAGFEVAAMEGIDVAFNDVGRLSGEEIYAHEKGFFETSGGTGNLRARLRLAPAEDRSTLRTRSPGAGDLCAGMQALGRSKTISRARTGQGIRSASRRIAREQESFEFRVPGFELIGTGNHHFRPTGIRKVC